jgi:hypothetical protein
LTGGPFTDKGAVPASAMNVTASAEDLARGYEALRAEALGTSPTITPRGRAVLLGKGLVAWMRALPPTTPARRAGRSPIDAPALTSSGVRAELVDVLTAMALGAGRRWGHAS